MAQRTRIRRRVRRARPQVRRSAGGPQTAARGEGGRAQAATGDLMIGGARDPAERIADRTADRIMRMTAPAALAGHGVGAGDGPSPKDKEEDEKVRAKPLPGTATVAPGAAAAPASPSASAAIGSLGAGRALAPAERAFFEPRFGAELSAVRVHEGARAEHASKAINARAFAHGNDIAFARDEYVLGTDEGRRLMAHELAHVVEQTSEIRREDGDDEGGEQQPPAPVPTTVTLSFHGAIPVGQTGPTQLSATADVGGITWSLAPDSTQPASGTTIDAQGHITIDANQTPGSLRVTATNADGASAFTQMFVASTPTGVSATAFSSDLTNAASHYGAAFQNTFISSDGVAASLEGMRIGERFPSAPSPTGASHAFSGSAWPFGARDTFTLSTGTLASDAGGAWSLDSSAQFGPPPAGSTLQQGDNLSTDKNLINVGNHIQSASNARPVGPLPVTMTLDQDLYWYNPLAAAARRWTKFVTLAHSRTLRESSGSLEFVTTLNGEEHVQNYEGKTAVFNLTATPASLSRSLGPQPDGSTPAAKTVALSVSTLPGSLPSGETLTWAFIGNAAGCTLTADASDSTLATLSVGTSAATITIEVADQTATNRARVTIRIT